MCLNCGCNAEPSKVERVKDHPLKGQCASYRECRVGGDFLLIYRADDAMGRNGGIVFVRAGTHSELFQE